MMCVTCNVAVTQVHVRTRPCFGRDDVTCKRIFVTVTQVDMRTRPCFGRDDVTCKRIVVAVTGSRENETVLRT